jgi:hypothetical protein
MTALLLALGLFSIAWVIHLVWWRICLPRHHTTALVLLFTTVPVAVGALLATTDRLGILTPSAWASVALFHTGSSLCYFITYAGVEETSPSLVIIRALERAGQAGATRGDLAPFISNESFITPRLNSLQRDGFVTLQTGCYHLTKRGRSAARLARHVSHVFNLGQVA